MNIDPPPPDTCPQLGIPWKDLPMCQPKSIDALTVQEQKRLWAKVDKTAGPNGCWTWTSSVMKNGYGVFQLRGKTRLAHRVIAAVNGIMTTAEKPLICHACDNRKCCNPAHFFIGSHADNMLDMKTKGRAGNKNPARGDAHMSRKYPERLQRGENHWTRRNPERIPRGELSGARKHPEKYARGESSYLAKLTEAKVLAILGALSSGATQRQTAKQFGVCQATVGHIATGKNWNHVWRKYHNV